MRFFLRKLVCFLVLHGLPGASSQLKAGESHRPLRIQTLDCDAGRLEVTPADQAFRVEFR